MDYGIWQGAEKATGNLAATGMKLMEFQANKQIAADRMALDNKRFMMEKEQHDVATGLAKKQAAEWEAQHTPIPAEQAFLQFGVTDPVSKKAFQEKFAHLLEPGGATGVPMIKPVHFQEIGKFINGGTADSIQWGLSVAKGKAELNQAEVKKVETEIQDLVDKGKWDEETKGKYQAILGELYATQGKLENAATELEKNYKRVTAKYGTAAEGATIFNETTGEIVGQGTPKSGPVPDMVTIYGPNGETQRVAVPKSGTYTPPDKWSLKAPDKPERPDKPLRKQQTQLIDEDGTPLIFDPENGIYLRPDGRPVQGAARRLPAETAVSGATFDSLLATTAKILKNPKRGEYTGPWDSVKNRVKAAIIGAPEFTTFRTQIEQMIETSYALSGKQISEKEIKMLEKLRGSLDMPDSSFDAAMKEYKSWLEQKQKLRGKAFKASGYSSGQGNATTKIGRYEVERID